MNLYEEMRSAIDILREEEERVRRQLRSPGSWIASAALHLTGLPLDANFDECDEATRDAMAILEKAYREVTGGRR